MPAYSPNDQTLAVAGFPMTGYAEGTFVTVTQQSESAAAFRGADGQTSFAVDKGKTQLIQIEFTLQQTSAANTYMAGLLAAQTLGAVPFPASSTNKTTLESTVLGQAVITKAPDTAFSQGIEGRTWTMIGPGNIIPGGSILP
jgi:hypothetical protein